MNQNLLIWAKLKIKKIIFFPYCLFFRRNICAVQLPDVGEEHVTNDKVDLSPGCLGVKRLSDTITIKIVLNVTMGQKDLRDCS